MTINAQRLPLTDLSELREDGVNTPHTADGRRMGFTITFFPKSEQEWVALTGHDRISAQACESARGEILLNKASGMWPWTVDAQIALPLDRAVALLLAEREIRREGVRLELRWFPPQVTPEALLRIADDWGQS